MSAKRLLSNLALLALAALLCGCPQNNTGDQPAGSTAPAGVDRFLLFPNPVAPSVQAGQGAYETNTDEYAAAYYRAVDPDNQRLTLDGWKSANGFGAESPVQHTAVFRDVKDLGYGRLMTGRINVDNAGTGDVRVAFYVQNYNVSSASGGGYSGLNVDAAVDQISKWHVGTNAIEWSTSRCTTDDPCTGNSNGFKFAKFYNFAPDGTRQTMVDLDGRGPKAMPGACISCHGGSAGPLTPKDASGNKRFPLIENTQTRKRGDTLGRLQGMNVGSFEYSIQSNFTRVAQEAKLKDFNRWILCTYPGGGTVTDATGATICTRPAAGPNGWQGAAAEKIQAWYGGVSLTSLTFSDVNANNYFPGGWSLNSTLYTGVVGPFCSTCHSLRGTSTGSSSDIDFMSLTKFQSYADRIKAHVFDRGNMPLALIVYEDFWRSTAPATLAAFIDSVLGAGTATAGGMVLMPGRPIANPGPNRMVKTLASATLSGEDSLFATTYNWSATGPGSVSFGSPNAPRTTFIAGAMGDYTVTLAVNGGAGPDSVKSMKVTVDDNFPDPLALKFAHVKSVLQSASATCITCHTAAGPAPIAYTNFDRNGDITINSTDDDWLYKDVLGRVNFTEVAASPLLRKPTGNHHAGGAPINLATTGLENYSIIYNWILAGAPAGNIAAILEVNGGVNPALVSFSGPAIGPFNSTNIVLDGGQSIGPSGATLNYTWTVLSTPPGADTPAISSTGPTSTTAALQVHAVGDYVVRLEVSAGGFSDTTQRTITVGETPLSFSPSVVNLSGGSVPVVFGGTSSTGTITVSPGQTAGNPISCDWVVTPVTLGATGVTLGTNSCAGATLNVTANTTANAVGKTFLITLTERNVTLPAVTPPGQQFTVTVGSGNPTGASFSPLTANVGFTIGTNPANTPAIRINGAATSTINLTAVATGAGTLNYSWSISSAGTTGCSIPAGSSTATTKLLTIQRSGTCSVTLTVSNGLLPNATTTSSVVISSTVVFSQVAAILGNAGTASPGTNDNCTGCHSGLTGGATPSWVTDGSINGNINLAARLGTVTVGAAQSTLLLICPTNAAGSTSCAGMPSPQGGFGGGVFNNYDAFLTWILNGKP